MRQTLFLVAKEATQWLEDPCWSPIGLTLISEHKQYAIPVGTLNPAFGLLFRKDRHDGCQLHVSWFGLQNLSEDLFITQPPTTGMALRYGVDRDFFWLHRDGGVTVSTVKDCLKRLGMDTSPETVCLLDVARMALMNTKNLAIRAVLDRNPDGAQ